MSIFSRILFFLLLSVLRAGAVEVPGPSASLLANPTYSGGIGLIYSCVTNYYVATTGNDGNNGSIGAPWLTIQHANALTRSPGDCINVAAGTYVWTTAFTTSRGGNLAAPTGYVVYRCQTLNACLITNSGGATGNFWAVTAPYVVIDGFDINGGIDPNSYFGGAVACIVSSIPSTTTPSHHLWILNNKIHNCNQAGIGLQDSEYYFSIHNEIYNNAWQSSFQGSGIGYVSLKRLGDNLNPYPPYTRTAADLTIAPFNNIVSFNFVHDNGCPLCTSFAASFTTTASTHSNLTLDTLASAGTSVSFTGSIAGTTLTAPASPALVVGQVLSGATSTAVSQSTVITGGSGTTWTINNSQTVGSQAMTAATLVPMTLIAGPCVQPMTYISSIVAGTITMTRPATCTQAGGTYIFYTENGGHSDGNGIIMDTFCGVSCGGTGTQDYNYVNNQTLVSFNDSQFNGGRGVHMFGTYYTTVANNSTYHNGLDLSFQGLVADLSQSGTINGAWYSNVAYAVDTINPYCFGGNQCTNSMIAGNGRLVDTNLIYFNNVIFGSGGLKLFNNDTTYWVNANNKPNKDPFYVDETSATIGNLHLQATSPAIGYAFPSAFFYLPKGTNDAGAYQSGSSGIFSVKAFAIAPQTGGNIANFDGGISTVSNVSIPTPLTCSQATSFLARTSGLDRVHIDGYSNFICGLVVDGVFAKLDVLYMFATQNAPTSLLNLVSASFNGTASGSPPWVQNKGYTGNDAATPTRFIDTGYIPSSSGGHYAQDSAHLSVWSLTNTQDSSGGDAIGTANVGFTRLRPRLNDDNFYVDINNSAFNFTVFANTDSTGHYLGNRTVSTTMTGYKNASLAITAADTSAAQNFSLYVLATNDSGNAINGSGKQIAMASIGGGLTQTDITNLCHRTNIYLTAVGAAASGIC